MKTLIIQAHSGRIKNKEIVEEPLEEAVKRQAKKLMDSEWIPSFSDFMVIKDSIDVELKLPLKKEDFELYREYDLRKKDSSTATASLPVYFIVYESLKLAEDKYHDRGVAIVAPYTSEEHAEMLEQLLSETTRKPSPEELEERIPEELLLEEGEGKKKRGRKKKR